MANEQPVNRQRIAIVGAGPAGFYAAAALLEADDVELTIDFIDKLHAPFGLLRYGVAPDHQKIKRVRVVFEKILRDPRVQFYGGIKLGRDISRGELREHYDRVIYATGSQGDRRLNIPGEELPGVYSATEFVAWYNGHPEFADLDPDLDVTDVVIIGAGNVALDVARLLAKSHGELAETDIADHALARLSQSRVQNISIVARRGPAEAKFTNPELKEFGILANAQPFVRLEDFRWDEATDAELAEDRIRRRNVEIMREFHDLSVERARRVHFRFAESPTRILGDERGMTHVEVVRNELRRDERGRIRPVATEQTEWIPAQMLIRSIGYLGTPIADLPFDERRGVMPTRDGRLLSAPDGEISAGEYVVGWAKRGASGVIGTNKPDAEETAASVLEDIRHQPQRDPSPGIGGKLTEKQLRWIDCERWRALDRLERDRGERSGRPRVKFVHGHEYYEALDGSSSS